MRAFTLHEPIAEKMRALLQQPIRERYRHQDVYDIAYLIDDHDFSASGKFEILATLIEKCRSSCIEAKQTSMDDPEVKRRAAADRDRLTLEVSDLPNFEDRFALMGDLYVSLPWDEPQQNS